MVVNTASAKAEFGRAVQEIANIADGAGVRMPAEGRVGGVAEVKLAIEDLRELLVQSDRRELAAEPPIMLAPNPAQSFDEIEVVLHLILVGLRSGPELKAGADESKFVNVVGQIVGGAVDADLAGSDWRHVDVAVVDAHKAERGSRSPVWVKRRESR